MALIGEGREVGGN